ncbi:MAG: hypothetical protein ACOYZ7_12590, partial [Chloroflexota bacterium]
QSGKVGFTVTYCQDQMGENALVYRLARIEIEVSDHQGGAHGGYLVRVYNGAGGSGSQWGYAWSGANGLTTFYLVEGNYGYLVEKNGAQSGKVGFTVEYCKDQHLVYKLSKITITVQSSGGSGLSGYLVRVYNDTNEQWGYQWTNASGVTTFYLVEGGYKYKVEKNSYSAWGDDSPFTVSYDTDQALTHTVS